MRKNSGAALPSRVSRQPPRPSWLRAPLESRALLYGPQWPYYGRETRHVHSRLIPTSIRNRLSESCFHPVRCYGSTADRRSRAGGRTHFSFPPFRVSTRRQVFVEQRRLRWTNSKGIRFFVVPRASSHSDPPEHAFI
jgi:hypothetical protein